MIKQRDEESNMDSESTLPERISSNIDWYLVAYPGLDAEEKQAVDDFVGEHPEHRTELDEARRLSRLLYDARALSDARRDPETLSYALIAEHVKGSWMPESLAHALHRLKRRRPASAGVSVAYLTHQERIESESGVRPAVDHFESLTGHVVRESSAEYNPGAPRGVLSRRSPGANRRGSVGVADRDRRSGKRSWASRTLRSIGDTAIIAVGVVIVLVIANYNNEIPLERMAHIHSSDMNWAVVGEFDRGFLSLYELKVLENYQRSLKIIADSRKSVFGLFPSYRMTDLFRARDLLKRTIKDDERVRSPSAESLLLLGKLNYLLGDLHKVLPLLQEASLLDGPAAEEAYTFLNMFGPPGRNPPPKRKLPLKK